MQNFWCSVRPKYILFASSASRFGFTIWRVKGYVSKLFEKTSNFNIFWCESDKDLVLLTLNPKNSVQVKNLQSDWREYRPERLILPIHYFKLRGRVSPGKIFIIEAKSCCFLTCRSIWIMSKFKFCKTHFSPDSVFWFQRGTFPLLHLAHPDRYWDQLM